MEHLSNDHKDHPYQHKNGHKICDEKGHPLLSLNESQWKRQQQSESPKGGKTTSEQVLGLFFRHQQFRHQNSDDSLEMLWSYYVFSFRTTAIGSLEVSMIVFEALPLF